MKPIKPNEKEKEALSLFYNRFYDLYEEIIRDDFINKEANIRFFKLREVFSIYKELLSYKPIRMYLEWMKKGGRPHLEGIIADELFSFIRNLLLHFPIFDTWDEVYINKNLATWSKVGQIDKFLNKCIKLKIDGKGTVKYRIWEEQKQKMTYFDVNFPEKYANNDIYLKDIITEEVGTKFCMALMREILDKQVENPEEPIIRIMSQVYFPVGK
ncbi:hypothetical protein [Vagococcus lutrae]|uniref:hypothetical protein n=1 Tax=Vagococcus lutrae TaxID=81947 RepID=UPI0023A91EC6|nr:hypothetical protein [Vagococcus lutrae]WEB81035.1 hypothetical protein LVJ09_07545 [Vagococcus lutrae]